MSQNGQEPWWAKSDLSGDKLPMPRTKTRTKRGQGIFAVAAFVGILASMVGVVSLSPDPMAPGEGQFGSIVYPADTASLVAKCGDTFSFDPPAKYYGAVPADFFNNPNGPGTIKRNVPIHPMIIPAYGYFYAGDVTEFEQKIYEPGDRLIPEHYEYNKHLWDGWKIIWYDPGEDGIDSATREAMQNFIDSHDKTVALPWMHERKLPMERTFAFSSWNVTRSCDLWSTEIVQEFYDFSNELDKGRDKDNYPPVQLDTMGELRQVDIQP